MPELPEVEVVVDQLRPRLIGRRFSGSKLLHPDVFEAAAGWRLADLHGPCLQRLEEPCVVDGDDRLIGERRYELYFLGTEQTLLIAH